MNSQKLAKQLRAHLSRRNVKTVLRSSPRKEFAKEAGGKILFKYFYAKIDIFSEAKYIAMTSKLEELLSRDNLIFRMRISKWAKL